nr:hypothetical protein [Sedimentibacter sp.]
MVYNLDIEYTIDKIKIFKRLHIEENTETYKNADSYFIGLYNIVRKNMKITALYTIVDSFNLEYKELDRFEKYVLCFISAKDDLSNISNNMMSSGEYLKGYLINEMATDVIFNVSNKMNSIIREQTKKLGCELSKRFAPGDDGLQLKHQKTILEYLKKEVDIDASLSEEYMIIPGISLLYLYGLDKCTLNHSLSSDKCVSCSNLNCEYREQKS